MIKRVLIVLGSAFGIFILIGIIAVATSNDENPKPIPTQITNAPINTPEPVQVRPTAATPKPSSFEPIIITGIEGKTTPPFLITTDEWIIEWSYQTDEPDYASMSIFIYPRGETAIFSEALMFLDNEQGSSYSYAGAGDYYLKVTAAGIQSWEIIIKPPK